MKRIYRFDTFDNRGVKLAGGIGVHADTMEEAETKARNMMEAGESSIQFRNNAPCHPARKCGICAEQAGKEPT
jgi:hypothetical protein